MLMIYTLCQKVIISGNYEPISMQNKLDVFLLTNRFTIEQFTELTGILKAQQEAE